MSGTDSLQNVARMSKPRVIRVIVEVQRWRMKAGAKSKEVMGA